MTTRAPASSTVANGEEVVAKYREPASYAKPLSKDTVRFERLLPGPLERIWSYLTDSEKRGKWLASGEMAPHVGADVTLTFAHASLSPVKVPAPEKFRKYEPSVQSHHKVLRYDPTRFLSITWGDGSEVDFELTPEGNQVRLVITHRRLASRSDMLGVSGGWHTHLAVLEEHLNGRVPPSFWTLFDGIEGVYDKRYTE